MLIFMTNKTIYRRFHLNNISKRDPTLPSSKHLQTVHYSDNNQKREVLLLGIGLSLQLFEFRLRYQVQCTKNCRLFDKMNMQRIQQIVYLIK